MRNKNIVYKNGVVLRPCAHCKQSKFLEDFYMNKSGSLHSWCKDCEKQNALSQPDLMKIRSRRHYQMNKEKVWEHKLVRIFGLTASGYAALLLKQKGVCAICKRADRTGRKLAVDHDHTTGKVRGLLCMDCNTGLGKFWDSPVLLWAAVKYLKNRLPN